MATKVEREIVELERRYWQALKDNDTDTAAELTDDPCMVTGPQGLGVIDRKTLVEMMSKASYTLRDFRMTGEPEVRMLGDDVAIIAYRVHEDFTVDGAPLSLDVTDTSTWVRRDGHWRCALHTEAIAGDPFGRDRKPAEQPRAG